MFEGRDHELMLVVNTLGIVVMALVVAYHFLTARTKDAD